MAHNITQQDLNAVRQLMHVFRALEKFEPLIQGVLKAEEGASIAEQQKNQALRELEAATDAIQKAKEEHRREVEKLKAQRVDMLTKAEAEVNAERHRRESEMTNDLGAKRNKAEGEISHLGEVIKQKQGHIDELSEQISDLQKKRSDLQKEEKALEASIARLHESQEKARARITEMLKSVGA